MCTDQTECRTGGWTYRRMGPSGHALRHVCHAPPPTARPTVPYADHPCALADTAPPSPSRKADHSALHLMAPHSPNYGRRPPSSPPHGSWFGGDPSSRAPRTPGDVASAYHREPCLFTRAHITVQQMQPRPHSNSRCITGAAMVRWGLLSPPPPPTPHHTFRQHCGRCRTGIGVCPPTHCCVPLNLHPSPSPVARLQLPRPPPPPSPHTHTHRTLFGVE